MSDLILTSTQNPAIKQVRKLHRSKERKRQNLLLLEGNNSVASALANRFPLVTVFCTAKWQERHPLLWQSFTDRDLRVQLVSSEVLKSIATTVNPDGVVATARRAISQTPSADSVKLGLAVETLQDPGNLGTIIRTAVATEVDRLWLSEDSVDLDNPKVLRASVGEWFRLPMAVPPNLQDAIANQKQQGVQIVATVPQSKQTYWDLDLTLPTLLLIGNEGAGLSSELISLANKQISIPLANEVESLNAAIATGLILYEAKRQRKSQ